MLMALVVVGFAWYANTSKRDKIYCRFKRVNRTQIAKFVKMTSRYVIFDHKRYDIIASCVVFEWWDKGIIHMLFPQWVATMDFTYASRWPHDPKTLKPVVISPEVRDAMNKEEWAKSYFKSSVPKSAKQTQSLIQQYLPWISIFLIVLVGFWLYNNQQALGAQMGALENALKAITR